jgi:MFS family permease
VPKDFRRVIIAAAVGNVIEWYDFYIFGSLAAVLSVKFFEQSHPVAALLSTIALFTAGFLIRPLGAFLFGWMGDRIGRKYTFLVTLTGMGVGTGCIGLIPTYEQIGLSAAFILFGLRMIQGLCLGGEYGGAITYVAEHVSDERRGYYTGWLQTSPTLGIVVSLAVIIATRTYFGTEVFNAWAWRVPFLVSFLLVAIAIYIRLQLQETPIFQEIRAKGLMTKNPWKEAFLSSNIKLVLIASIIVIGEGVVWYSGQFWALYFLQQVSKVDPLTTAYIVMAGLLIGTPTLILWGWVSDLIGRKPVILGGFLLAAVTYYPLYAWLGAVTRSRVTSTMWWPSSSSRSSSTMSAWSMGRSAHSWRNTSLPASATRPCRFRTISETAGAAVWCPSSRRRLSRRRAASATPCSIRSWCPRCASCSASS